VEFLGGIESGLLGVKGKAHKRFCRGLELMPIQYRKHGALLWKLRNSSVHAYIGDTQHANLTIDASKVEPAIAQQRHGIAVGENAVSIDVTAFTEHVDQAWAQPNQLIQTDPACANNAQQALGRVPRLL
jgi:hypothetical protein